MLECTSVTPSQGGEVITTRPYKVDTGMHCNAHFICTCNINNKLQSCCRMIQFRVSSALIIAEHPSLSIQSGDLVCVNCLFKHYTKSPLCIDRDGCSAIISAEETRRFKCILRPCFLNGSQQYLHTSIDMTKAQRILSTRKAQIRC